MIASSGNCTHNNEMHAKSDQASKWSVKHGQVLVGVVNIFSHLNSLSTNPHNWSNTLKQFVGLKPATF